MLIDVQLLSIKASASTNIGTGNGDGVLMSDSMGRAWLHG
jgi:hypothetical protein